jgi:hypothetical protein
MDSKAKALKADTTATQWECHKVTLFFPLLYQANLSYYRSEPNLPLTEWVKDIL